MTLHIDKEKLREILYEWVKPELGMDILADVIKQASESECKNCYGKGYYTRAYQIRGSDDFGGEGFVSDLKEERVACSCQDKEASESKGQRIAQTIQAMIWHSIAQYQTNEGMAFKSVEEKRAAAEAELARLIDEL